ncbi:type II toxin-antitoxin system RelB/DinJ family antitoxin [Lactobacillus sp. ESL0681]|uniref:type II toxin-antitoxin system RelB/DinJ family antitoxin n=1 Tax=Lactobacillus sp. ESL0681 TaxID=2983211 RepID=UPI0023F68D3C|nr:type II toxin-antitoxin system RelB/DinJ family antitoxin [Lactobacillus sp. ESL0681]WEV39975.1 type II toxin-antitoxin system RelB/DinJ family antitoxin [Lactobacillus sp. ESL0681]
MVERATGKKRLQIQMDSNLVNEVGQIFDELGLSPTTAVTMFYKRVAAEGGLPFDARLSRHEKASLSLANAVKLLPVQEVKTVDEYNKWVEDDD